MHVLVVDDDPILLDMVSSYLEGQGMHVASASGPQEAVRQIVTSEPDLIMLDLRLGQDNGLDLLREIRSRHDIPDQRRCLPPKSDRVVGLELGADDYVTKPSACGSSWRGSVRSCAGERRCVRSLGRMRNAGRYHFGGWQLDRRVRRLTAPDGEQVALTKGEYTLLTVFLDAPQRPLTREHLLQATRVHDDIFDRRHRPYRSCG